MSEKYIYDYVKQYFEDQGCELLSEKYTNCDTKMDYVCSCGELSKINFYCFKQCHRCKKCGQEKKANTQRLSYDYVKQYFEDQGCKLLEKEYKNYNTKMRYICNCGNLSKISFSSFKQGSRCKKCGQMRSIEKQKYTYDYVKQYFEDQGCKLISKEYINCDTPLDYICNCGYLSKINFYCFKQGSRCKKCGQEKKANTQRLSYDYVKQYFEDQGCKLLSKEYINNGVLMDYICSCRNKSKIIFSSFKQGSRCKKCGGTEKLSYDYIKQYFKDQDCQLISKEYKNCGTLLDYICSCGNKSKINFDSFKIGCRCKKCGIKKMTGPNNSSWNPNLTNEEREKNKTRLSDIDYKLWRRRVFKKYDYTCQICNQRGKLINAHHIESYATNKELRTKVSNGIVFCEDHHRLFHKIYGRTNNNRTQLEQFLSQQKIKGVA